MADITGVIGAITGIVSLLVSGAAYRSTKTIKRQDLRISLTTSLSELHDDARSLLEHLQRAKGSHAAVQAAVGLYQSGGFQKWQTEWDADYAEATALIASIGLMPTDPAVYTGMHETALERKIASAVDSRLKITRLRKKYDESLRQDDVTREHLRR